MIDFILFVSLSAIYAGGFWCGSKYGTATAMVADVKARIKSMI